MASFYSIITILTSIFRVPNYAGCYIKRAGDDVKRIIIPYILWQVMLSYPWSPLIHQLQLFMSYTSFERDVGYFWQRCCSQEGLLSLVGKRVTQRFSRTNLLKAFDISLPLILSWNTIVGKQGIGRGQEPFLQFRNVRRWFGGRGTSEVHLMFQGWSYVK